MAIDFLNEQWWVAVLLDIFLSLSDSYMTIVGAKLYKKHAAEPVFRTLKTEKSA
jgi:hypothetical protein